MADSLNIKNPSVRQGDLDLRTDEQGYITSISGHPIAGGGGGGTTYYGDNEYIQIKNGTVNTFTVTDKVKNVVDNLTVEIAEQIDAQTYNKNAIDTKLSAKQDELVFAGYEDKIETINGSGFIVNGYVSEVTYQIDKNNFNKQIDYLSSSVSNKQDKLTFEYDEDNKVSAINGSALAGQGGGTGDYSAGTDLKIENNIISVDTNGNPNNTASNTRNFVEGSWTVASGYNSHAEGMATTAYGYAVHAQGMWTKFSSSKWSDTKHQTPIDIYWAAGAGATVEGYCNATTSCPMSGTEGQSDYGPIHGGILKVIGNGNVVHDQSVDPDAHIHELQPSDALIIFKDGCISAAGNISANGVELGAGGTTYQGRNGVNVDGGYVELTQTAYESVTSIPSISNDVETLKTASGDWNKVSDKLDTTAFSDVSSTFLTAHQSLDEYATKEYANNASANALSESETWVENQHYLSAVPDEYALKTDIPTTVAQLTDSGNYYTKNQTSGATELSTEFAKYVTSSNVTSQDTDYVMTTTGWKVLTLPGGGMTQVIHDETLTGQGNDDNSKLGVAWSALSGNTINSAKSAGSATSALSADKAASASASKRLQDSTSGPVIQVGDVTALQNWASSNSSTWDSVTAKLGTAQYANDSATFVTSSSSTITGTKQYALTTAGWTEVQVGASLTASSGININNNLINVTLGRNLKFDTYSSVTTEDDISATSYRAGEYDNQYTIVNKFGLETYFSSAPDSAKLTLTTNGLYNSLVGGNRCITADYNVNHLFFKSYDNIGTYSGDYSQVEIKVLQETAPEATQHRSSITLTDYYEGVEHTGLITVEKIAQWDQGGSFTGVTTAGSISGDGLTNPLGLVTSAEQALTSVSSKVDKPTSIVDKYLVLRTDSNGDVSGWSDLKEQCYSKTEATGTFVATANIDTTTLSGDGKTGSTKLGVKTDVIATKDYVNSSFLPTSGGTVSGQLVVSGGSNFDQENLKLIRTGLNGYGRIGLASNGALAVKVDDNNSNTTQINIAANASNNELIQVQHGGTTAYLIPAVTSTTTAGLTNDGILHIILES